MRMTMANGAESNVRKRRVRAGVFPIWFSALTATLTLSASVTQASGGKPRMPAENLIAHEIALSKNCYELYKNLRPIHDRISDRLVGFWENGALGYPDSFFQPTLGHARTLVREANRSLKNFELRSLLRGIVAMTTGWGNCGEHTVATHVEMLGYRDADGFFGCEGARLFSAENPGIDHVWAEVFFPEPGFDEDIVRVTIQSDSDAPMFIPTEVDGRKGIFFDAHFGSYLVVRWGALRDLGQLWGGKDYRIQRTRFDPSKVNYEDLLHVRKLAYDLSKKVTSREAYDARNPRR